MGFVFAASTQHSLEERERQRERERELFTISLITVDIGRALVTIVKVVYPNNKC